MRTNPGQRGAVFGEISPRLEGRDNLDQYFESLRASQNYIISPQGAILRRSGTRYMGAPKNATATRLIPFEFALDQVYVMEFGDLYIRFFVPSGPLEDPPSTPVELASPYTEAQLPDLWFEQQGNFLYLTHPSHPPYLLTRTSLTSFTLSKVVWREGRQPMAINNLNASWTFQIGGSAPNYTLTRAGAGNRDFVAADVGRFVRLSNGTAQRWFEITAFTSASVVTVQVRDADVSAPFTTTTSDWSLGAFSNTMGPRVVSFHEGRCYYGGTVEQPDRLWASTSDDFNYFQQRNAAGAVVDDDAFTRRASSASLNSILWMVSAGDALGVGTSGGEFTLSASEDVVLTPSSANLKNSTRRGSEPIKPEVVDGDIVFAQRGGSKLRRIAYQLTDDRFVSNDLTILAEHLYRQPLRRLAYQQTPDTVLWTLRADGALVGVTVEREQKVVAFHTHRIADYGGGAARVLDMCVIPEGSDGDLLWLLVERQEGMTRTRFIEKMQPTFNPELTALSAQQERINASESAWFLDSALELDSPLEIEAATLAAPCEITSTGHGLTTGDRVRIRDMRGLTGLNRRSFTVTTTGADTFTLDDSDTTGEAAYEGGGVAREEVLVISGLDHLEGQTVSVLADGGERPDDTVVSGSITLDSPASIVRVGLRYKSFGLTQRFVSQGGLGALSGQIARVQRVVFRFLNTLGMKIGYGADPEFLEPVEFRTLPTIMDEPLPLFSGDKDVSAAAQWNRDPSIYFEQDAPLPGGVLAIYPRMEANER